MSYGDEPLRASVVYGDATAGQCAEVAFQTGQCKTVRKIQCKQ
jgi:hypothetical protein